MRMILPEKMQKELEELEKIIGMGGLRVLIQHHVQDVKTLIKKEVGDKFNDNTITIFMKSEFSAVIDILSQK